MATHQPTYSAPFDAIASRYDELFTNSAIGRAQRASVWSELERRFHAGQRVLDIGCGTGVDACFLAQRGVQVVACDSSSEMVNASTRRVREIGCQQRVLPIQCRAEDLLSVGKGPFDGALSNFGAVNCISDLRCLAGNLYSILRPGAPLIVCYLGPCCAWEIVWYLASGKPQRAFRRFRKTDTARIATGPPLQVFYPSPRFVAQVFRPWFRLNSLKGIGLTVPPSYLECWMARFPRFLSLAEMLDSWLARCPGIRLFSDHLLLEFERRPV